MGGPLENSERLELFFQGMPLLFLPTVTGLTDPKEITPVTLGSSTTGFSLIFYNSATGVSFEAGLGMTVLLVLVFFFTILFLLINYDL